MIKEAIDRILELAEVETEEWNGRVYTSKKFHLVEEPYPEHMRFEGLAGLVDFVKNDLHDIQAKKDVGSLFIHVASEELVSFYARKGFCRQHERTKLAEATLPYSATFQHDSFMSVEDFIIQMQTNYQVNEEQQRILALVGNITSEAETKTQDDGFTQSVSIRAGITLRENANIQNPFDLQPYRTFPEIAAQPSSPFILRVKGDREESPRVALFEIDNGLWKVSAVSKIKEYLKEHVGDIPVI